MPNSRLKKELVKLLDAEYRRAISENVKRALAAKKAVLNPSIKGSCNVNKSKVS